MINSTISLISWKFLPKPFFYWKGKSPKLCSLLRKDVCGLGSIMMVRILPPSFFEGDKVSSIESFRTDLPSLYSIESLESCILLTLSQKDFLDGLQSFPEIKEEIQEHLFKRLLQSQKTFYSCLKNVLSSATESWSKNIPILSNVFRSITSHLILELLRFL